MQARSSDAPGSSLDASVGQPPRLGDGEFDLQQHLLRVCVLLLLQEGPSTVGELCAGLRPLGFHRCAADLPEALHGLECEELTTSVYESAGDGYIRRLHVLMPAGERELERAAWEMRATEEVLGGFLARCGEHLLLEDVGG